MRRKQDIPWRFELVVRVFDLPHRLEKQLEELEANGDPNSLYPGLTIAKQQLDEIFARPPADGVTYPRPDPRRGIRKRN